MVRSTLLILAAAIAAITTPTPVLAENDMLIIAHRGASAERPEHTLAAYERAIIAGADYVEPDLVATKDLVLVARHENDLSETTDVAGREEFEHRRRDKMIDGQLTAGWFAEDFTLAELRTLRAKERIPTIRPANTRYDGLYQIPTFAEIIQLVRAKEAETGRRIGIYPELKHPTFLLQEAGIDVVDLLVTQLRNEGLDGEDAKIFLQCFEVGTLQRLNQMTDNPLVQLAKPGAGPADEPAMTYEEMLTPTGLADVAQYADAVGVYTGMILNADGSAKSLVADAKAHGLDVHAWTLRPENAFLPDMLKGEGGDAGLGDAAALQAMLAKAGVTGVFADDPASAVKANKR
ncbi:MAG: glycerophosphodiester phosphodiesterase family protein [Marinomonas sp.]